MVTPGTPSRSIDARSRPIPADLRSPWFVAVGLAVAVIAMPVMSPTPVPAFGDLTYPALEVLALAGAVTGWLMTDTLAAHGRSRWAVVVFLAVLALTAYRTVTAEAGPMDVVAFGAVAGSMVRGGLRESSDPAVLVAIAAGSTWVAYDIPNVLHRPMRDLHTYLNAAASELAGGHAYLQGPLTTLPDADRYPFVYPPFTLPLFEVLSRLPVPAVEIAWLGVSVAAVIAGLWLTGVRGRWLVAFLAWPVIAVGLSVGNVAALSFLCFALGYRFAGSLVIAGLFKLQAGIPAIWALRERRLREVALGVGAIALLMLATIPLTGWTVWEEWVRALDFFNEGLDRYEMLGASLSRYIPGAAVIVVALVAIAIALRGRGRNGLGRFGLASIVGSPTLYIHGFGLLLPGAMTLPPSLFWFVSAIVAWDAWGIPVSGGWIAVGIVAAALIQSGGADLLAPADISPAASDLHPAGAGKPIWPDPPGARIRERRLAEEAELVEKSLDDPGGPKTFVEAGRDVVDFERRKTFLPGPSR